MCLCSRKRSDRQTDRQTAVSHFLIEWRLSDLNIPWGSFLIDIEFQTLFLNQFFFFFNQKSSLLNHPS